MNKIVLEQMIIFFLGRTYFTSNDGSQKIFFYQPILDTFIDKFINHAKYITTPEFNSRKFCSKIKTS